MEEKGIVARDCLPSEARCALLRLAAAGDNRGQQSRATFPFSSMSRFSLLQTDVKVEEPEMSENPTQLFKIYNIV